MLIYLILISSRDDVNNIEQYGIFDAIWASGILYHLDKPRLFLEKASRVCTRVIFLDSHFTYAYRTAGADKHNLSDVCDHDGLKCRWFYEHGDVSETELERHGLVILVKSAVVLGSKGISSASLSTTMVLIWCLSNITHWPKYFGRDGELLSLPRSMPFCRDQDRVKRLRRQLSRSSETFRSRLAYSVAVSATSRDRRIFAIRVAERVCLSSKRDLQFWRGPRVEPVPFQSASGPSPSGAGAATTWRPFG